MTAVFLPFSPTLNVINADILVVLGYRVKRPTLLVFRYRQRLVHSSSSAYIFLKLTHAAARFACDS